MENIDNIYESFSFNNKYIMKSLFLLINDCCDYNRKKFLSIFYINLCKKFNIGFEKFN
jgi:hypothetical protein